VIAVGSTSNYFGVPGAREHTISLNATEDAERFRLRCCAADPGRAEEGRQWAEAGVLDIVIIGGGATGVELAAELREASGVYAAYGFRQLQAERDVRITLLEGAPRILAPLPEKVSAAALPAAISAPSPWSPIPASPRSPPTASRAGECLSGAYRGVGGRHQGAGFPQALGLPTVKGGPARRWRQPAVKGYDYIYALGDCAACTGPDGKLVPPRAQAAHQQADYLLKTFMRQNAGQPAQTAPYAYRDYGSLVSFGQTTSVGSLMGSLKGLSWFVDGFVARMMYVSLHLMHHQAVLGTVRTGVLALARFLIKRSTPLVKLH
jgi:NADH dehydrogenase